MPPTLRAGATARRGQPRICRVLYEAARRAPLLPCALAEFVDLVVPEVQARGLFRRECEGTTLRDHFRLPRVTAPAGYERHVGGQL